MSELNEYLVAYEEDKTVRAHNIELAAAWDQGYEAALDNHQELLDRARHIRNSHGTDVWGAWLTMPDSEKDAWLVGAHYALVTDTPLTACHVRVCLVSILNGETE